MTDNTRDDESQPGPATQSADLTYTLDEDERLSEAVVRAVASLTDTPIIDLDPLYDVVDPEHLNGLFEETDLRQQSSVTFRFNRCTVTVTPDTVHVRECTDNGSEPESK